MLFVLPPALAALATFGAPPTPSPTMAWAQDGPDDHHAEQAPGEPAGGYGDLEPVLPASLVPS